MAADSQTPDSSGTSAVERDILSRWGGKSAILEDGFVAVPTSFLKYCGTLTPSLTPTEALFILELMVYKWDRRAPFPGYKALAQRMGVSEAYARKLARGLQAKGYVKRQARVGQTNRFDLSPLFEKLAVRAADEKEKRRKRRRADFRDEMEVAPDEE